MKELVQAIAEKYGYSGIQLFPPATKAMVQAFEQIIGFDLPVDFMEFYTICNGFECNEYIFRMIPLEEILEHNDNYGPRWLYFSEYMIYSDLWGLQQDEETGFEVFGGGCLHVPAKYPVQLFLTRFLRGVVFDAGGLYDWEDEGKRTG